MSFPPYQLLRFLIDILCLVQGIPFWLFLW